VPIAAEELLSIFMELRKSLGHAMVDVLIDGLEIYKVNLQGRGAYSLNDLTEALDQVCGSDAAFLIINKIKKNSKNKEERHE
jgi:hypothetical protein